jgi:hypothetical protein
MSSDCASQAAATTTGIGGGTQKEIVQRIFDDYVNRGKS